MPSDRLKLVASPRTETGKRVAALRKAGRLPAVVFGRGTPSENVSIDAHEFELLRRRSGSNTLIDLSIDGAAPRPVLVHGVGRDHIHGRPLHVDLFVVQMTEEMTAEVPLVPTGESEAVKVHGGTLLHVTEHVKVRALPADLPDSIAYGIDSLVDFDAAIHVRDLVVPAGATLLTDLDEIVAKVLPPRVEEAVVAAPSEAVEGAEAGEGAEGGETGGESAGAGSE
jgi:large subunit ribosomal protein L25